MSASAMSASAMPSPYRGLTPYTEADAMYFFGRTAEIAIIAANLAITRLTIFYGPSGVGKSSVLRAGVIHQLQQNAAANAAVSGYPEIIPVYFNLWQHDPLAGLAQAVAAAVQPFWPASAENFVHASDSVPAFAAQLRTWSEATASDLLIVLDQFEEYFLYQSGESGPGSFAYELVQAVNTPDLRANFLLSLRDDAIARLDHFKGQISFLLDNRLSIEHLHRAAGRDAIIRPLEQYNADHGVVYRIEPALVTAVLDQVAHGKVILGHYSVGVTATATKPDRIEAPYLQLVLTRLWMEEEKLGSTLFRYQTLDNLGGAAKIIANYLDDTMAGLPTSHQAIAARCFDRLVTLGGTKIALSLDELTRYAKADASAVQEVLQQLLTKRLLRGVQSLTGAPQYEIFHDVLAQAVLDWQSRVPWRTAEHYLDSGLFDWREAKRSKNIELLLDSERYQYIWTYKEIFGALSDEANEFLARTALYHGDVSFSYWFNRLAERGRERLEAIAIDYVLHRSEDRRKAAQHAIIHAQRLHLLDDTALQQIADIFWQQFEATPALVAKHTKAEAETNNTLISPAGVYAPAIEIDVRESTSILLWTLRKFISAPHLFKVVPVAFRLWIRNQRTSPIVVSAASALLVALIIWVTWTINQNLQPSWQREPLLFAGPLSAITWVRSDPNFIYVITPTGPEVNSGATLWLHDRKKGRWDELKSSLTDAAIISLAVVELGGTKRLNQGFRGEGISKRRLYMSVLGEGIRRSDDNGHSWQLINSGLKSYDIGTLIKDESNPNVLYAGSRDSRGIFESRNGGNTWRDISGEELFGASISAMTYANYEGGALVVATSDTRILVRKRNDPTWKAVWSYPMTGSVTAMGIEQREKKTIYAGTERGDVWISADGGGTWTKVEKPFGVFSIVSVMPVPGKSKQAFLSTFGIGGYLIWKTENQGQEWQLITDNQFTREAVTIYIHRQEPDTLYAVGAPGFFETHNDGDSWVYHQIRSPIASIHRIAISPLNTVLTYVAVQGAIFSSTEPVVGAWRRGHGVTALTIRDIVADPDDQARAFAGVYLPNKWSVLFTENGGETWQPTARPGINETLLNDTTALEIAKAKGETILYAGTNGCGVIHSIDHGDSWETFGRWNCNLAPSSPKNVIDLVADPQDADTIYVTADSNRVYVSNNRGRNWQMYTLALSHQIEEIEVDPVIRGRVYLIAGTNGFWRSDDGGQTWNQYSTGLEEKSLNNLVSDSNASGTLYVSSRNGEIWKTTNSGEDWVSTKENLTVRGIADLAFDIQGRELVLSSGQAGLYRLKEGSLLGIQKE